MSTWFGSPAAGAASPTRRPSIWSPPRSSAAAWRRSASRWPSTSRVPRPRRSSTSRTNATPPCSTPGAASRRCRSASRSSCSRRRCRCGSRSSSSASTSSAKATCSSPTTRTTAAVTSPTTTCSRRSSRPIPTAPGGRRMVLIASIQCHHGDTGGGVPGGYNITATDIWGEGVRWPVVKVLDRGVERRDVLYALQANNRIPSYIGDLRAQIGVRAARRAAARRHHRPLRRRRGRGVRRLHDRLRGPPLPRGGRGVARRRVRGRLVRRPRPARQPRHPSAREGHASRATSSTIDFTGTDTRNELQAWSTFGNTRGYTVGQIAAMMDPEIPKNEGFFEQIKLVVPKGCVLNPEPGKPVSAGTHHPGADVGEVIAKAMQYVLPDRAVPQTYKTGIPTIIVGVDPRTGASFTDHSAEVYSGWCNASKGMDAWGALNASFGNLWKATAEINESLYPHVQWSRDYRTDARRTRRVARHLRLALREGSARRREGLHVRRRHEVPDARHLRRRDGSPNEMIIRYGSDDEFKVEAHRRVGADPRRRTHHVRLRRRRRLGRPARPRPAGRARRRARRVRVGRGREPRLRRRAHGSLEDLTLEIDEVGTHALREQMRAERTPAETAEHGLSRRGRRRGDVHRPHLRHARRARSCSTRRRRRSTTSRPA